MADTEKPEQPQTNGIENGLDEDERSKMRPADIDADVREMERRKRVEMIMSSKLFREELERIIELQLKDGNGPAGLLQQISDMMGIQSGKLHTTHMFRGSNCVTPINDIRGVESMGYEKGEKNLRCKLASVFRLMDLYGWSQGINNQITARLNQDEEHFLVNPHGMLFNEITASSLVKVDMQGNIVEPGTTNFSVNTQGFLLHSAIHASRPDVNCVIHIKTPSVLAVSSLKCGLLPICQEALVIGEVSQHPFVSGIFEPEEREKIIRNLGPHNKVLLLHNHGAVCCGSTVEEAFYNVYNTVLACETQMKLMPIGVENLLLVSDETRKQVYDAAHRAPETGASTDKKKFRVGEMEFEALIRMLDNAGFRTGYIYRHPLVKGELPKPKNDVEVPPAVSSLGYLIEQEELYKQGNWKKYIDGRNRLDRTKWLNSPNVYQKVEILETGTSDPKKITKWVDQNSEEWVAESSPTHSSTPVKIDSALQFVPKGTNPKEFKKLQQQIKENRRADKITSGPQSHILEGVSWEEAKKLQDANITQTGDQVILVGAASKGIIQRNYQHNALVYKTPYAKNPFDSMSDKEIEDYKQLVERKQRGDTDYEESQSESEAISSSRQDALRHFKSPLLSPQSATSETEEESRDEPRVLRIETKTAPRPIQAEVVLSDAESDTTDARVERSHSARYPKAEKPESVTLMNSFRKSWSLKREKDKSKDVENIYESRNLHFPNEYELDRTESLHYCVARLKQLTFKPVIVDLDAKPLRPLLKSASDPCDLSNLNDETATEVDNRQSEVFANVKSSLSKGNIPNTSDLKRNLYVRKKLLHSAKMKFLGQESFSRDDQVDDKPSKSPMQALISEIRETINDIMSPEQSKNSNGWNNSLKSVKRIERSRLESRSNESNVTWKGSSKDCRNEASTSESLKSTVFYDTPSRSPPMSFSDFKSEFSVLKIDFEKKERSDSSDCDCVAHGQHLPEKTFAVSNAEEKIDESQPGTENVVTEMVTFVNASDEEGTYTVTEDSLLPTYSFTESTETEWYYNKTIMKLENSQTVLEIRETEHKGENLEMPAKYIDTGIDTDFTSDKEIEIEANDLPAAEEKQKEGEALETTEDLENDVPACECSGLNKSSETDSSFLKSSSGQTSNDVDTSFAFKTETETSDKSPDKSSNLTRSSEEKKKFLKEMLLNPIKPIEEESSGSEETDLKEASEKTEEEGAKKSPSKLDVIPESPEFTNVDTEDAPITSSSKDTSPEVADSEKHLPEDEAPKEPEVVSEGEKENLKPEHKKKKNVNSSTKITVKKELKKKDSNEPVVSEIKLTIKNLKKCQSEKYEVKIQDLTNTSEDLSRSVSSAGENVDGYESYEMMDESCSCDAQQNLEELQDEVSSVIEKLQTIEDYFENEIEKHSSGSSQKRRNGSDEFTIEYNYREFEEVLNESNSKMPVSDSKCSDPFEDVPEVKPNKESKEFFVSSPLGDICGEIEVCDDDFESDAFTGLCQESDGDNTEHRTPHMSLENDVEGLALSSAFVVAVLSEAVMEVADEMCGSQKFEEEGTARTEVQVICNIQELTDGTDFETTTDGIVGMPVEEVEKLVAELCDITVEDWENATSGERIDSERSERVEENEKKVEELERPDREENSVRDEIVDRFSSCETQKEDSEAETKNQGDQLKNDLEEDQKKIESCEGKQVEESKEMIEIQGCQQGKTSELDNTADLEIKSESNGLISTEIKPEEEASSKDENELAENSGEDVVNDTVVVEPNDESLANPKELEREQLLIETRFLERNCNDFCKREKRPALTFPTTLALTYEPEEPQENEKNIGVVEYILNNLLDFVDEINKKNNVINLKVTNEDSLTDSVIEYGDMENVISVSGSIVDDLVESIECQMAEEAEGLSEDGQSKKMKKTERKKEDAIFKVTIATPAKKEIFINYSSNLSSIFNTTSDVDQIEELSNSYIKTDDVNEDFENLSSDNLDFFSTGSTDENSLNSSTCSVEDSLKGEPVCCGVRETVKSQRPLGIIHEMDEGDHSASSTETAASSITK